MTGAILTLMGGGAAKVTVAPPGAYGAGSTKTVFTNSVTASTDYPGVSWLWELTASVGISITNPTSAQTRFSNTGGSSGDYLQTNAIVRAFANGQEIASAFILVTIERF